MQCFPHFGRRPRRAAALVAALSAALSFSLALRAGAQPTAAPIEVTGVVTVVWGDPLGSGGAPTTQLLLTDAAGHVRLLELAATDLAGLGGLSGINRRRLRVVLSEGGGGDGTPRLIARSVEVLDPLPDAAQLVSRAVGSRRYATLLCRYRDQPVHRSATELRRLYTGETRGGAVDYFREVSSGALDLRGSAVFGWFDLPGTNADYAPNTAPDFARLMRDCLELADPVVDFTQFDGVNLQVNGLFGCCAFGGEVGLYRDGQWKIVGFTWMPSWASDPGLIAHEMGHSLTLPHSSGPYGQVYDSQWDVMSGGGYGASVHTIGHHKDVLGWIPPERSYVAPPGVSNVTLQLEPSAGSRAQAGGHLLARVPIPGSPHFYSLELRQRTGYDAALPAEGVVIHRVQQQPREGSYAYVVDGDNNGNVNDAGAVWTTGETFTDPANGVSIQVVGASPGSATLRVTTTRTPPSFALRATVLGKGRITESGFGRATDCASECSAPYTQGASLALSAIADPGWTFAGWGGDCSGTTIACAITMNGARAVQGTFIPGRRLEVIVNGSGRVDGDVSCEVSCGGYLPPNKATTLVAGRGAAGWYFDQWQGPCSGTQPTCPLVMDQDRSVTAVYRQGGAPVRIAIEGAGLVTSSHGGMYCADTYPFLCDSGFGIGRAVTFYSYAGSGWTLAEWTGAAASCGRAFSCTLTIQGPTVVGARFAGGRAITLSATGRRDSVATGAPIRNDSVLVSVGGSGTVAWTASATARFLTLSSSSGTGSGVVRYTRTAAGLAPGLHVDTITVTAAGVFGSPVRLVDSLIVESAPSLVVAALPILRDTIAWFDAPPRTIALPVSYTGSGASVTARLTHSPAATWNVLQGATIAGAGSLTWAITPNALAYPGTFTDTLVVTAPGALDSPRRFVHEVVILPRTVVAVLASRTIDTLAQNDTSGRTDSLEVSIGGSNGAQQAWTARLQDPAVRWLALESTGGVGPAMLRVRRRSASLAVGSYSTFIVVTAPGATPAQVTVQLRLVLEPPLALAALPVSRGDSLPVGAATPTRDSLTIAFTGFGRSSATWRASHGASSWLTLLTTRGGAGDPLRWTRSAAALPVGVFVDTVTVVADVTGERRLVVDTLRVLPRLALALDRAITRDTVSQGAIGERRDSVRVSATGYASSTAPWRATHGAATWLTLETTAGVGSDWLRWRRATGTLPIGTYVDTIVVTYNGGAGIARLVDSLVVDAPIVLATSRPVVRDSVLQGSTAARPDSLDLTLTGVRAAQQAWTVRSSGAPWLSLQTTGGTGDGRLRWTRNPTDLVAGTYTDTLVITTASGVRLVILDELRVVEPVVVTDCAISDLLGTSCLTSVERNFLDQAGNGDRLYNLGDLLAFLDRKRIVLTSEQEGRLLQPTIPRALDTRPPGGRSP